MNPQEQKRMLSILTCGVVVAIAPAVAMWAFNSKLNPESAVLAGVAALWPIAIGYITYRVARSTHRGDKKDDNNRGPEPGPVPAPSIPPTIVKPVAWNENAIIDATRHAISHSNRSRQDEVQPWDKVVL